jgi:replicative DNA helicase
VDYLQCITTQRSIDDRRQQINYIARTLTDTIKTMGAAGILASQVTDENIRESKDVEHAAEVVLIGRETEAQYDQYGECVQQSRRSLFVKKNKSGPKGAVVNLEWDDHTGSFRTRDVQFNGYFDDASR